MSFNVSALEEYVKLNSKSIAIKAVTAAKTADALVASKNVQSGVKGSAAILKMDTDVVFASGAGCGRTPSGSTTLSSKNIIVAPIQDCQDFCPKTLYNTYFTEMVAKGQRPEDETIDSAFAQSVMDLRSAKIAFEVEKLLWQGDTALTGANNLKYIDGILKQIDAGSAVDLTITGSTEVIVQLQGAHLAMPVAVRSQEDYRLFIGQDTYDSYLVEMANKNIFKPTDDFTLFGTTAKLFVTPGLNGTGKVVAARMSNLQLGLDGEGDSDKADFRLSAETNKWYSDFYFAVGIAVVNADNTQVGVGDIA